MTPTPLVTRLTRVAVFAGIVWAVAASFVAFELAALAGFDMLLDTKGGRALSLSGTVRDSTTCRAQEGAGGGEAASEPAGAAAQAWVLGVMAGMHAVVSRWDDDTATAADQRPRWRVLANERSARLLHAMTELAGELQVPKPAPFRAQQRADANTVFIGTIEADEGRTARGIAARYSERACHLYKLGSYWGYSAEVRNIVPGDRPAFGLEIEYHARKAGLPEELWAPALGATPSGATAAQVAADTQRLTEGITRHLVRAQ